jgi:hypothetical protein
MSLRTIAVDVNTRIIPDKNANSITAPMTTSMLYILTLLYVTDPLIAGWFFDILPLVLESAQTFCTNFISRNIVDILV